MRARALLPRQQLRLVAARRVAQPRHDHHIEFESLGLVDGHQLQACVGLRIGCGEQFRDAFFQRAEINDVAAFFQRFEQTKVRLRVFKIGALGDARWSAQCEPCAFDPARRRYTPPRRHKFMEYPAHAREPARAVGR